MSLLLLLAGCVPTIVHFECDSGAPFCNTLEVVEDERSLATGVSVTGLAIYAGVEQALLVDGEEVDDEAVPLIAHRDVMVRVLVAPSEDFKSRSLTARVYFYKDGDLYAAFQEDMDVEEASAWDQLESSFNLQIGGRLFEGDLTVKVEIVEASADTTGSEAEASPTYGPRDLSFTDVGETLRVVVVPIEYNADGSGRLPDTSDEQMEIYRQYMQWMYPVPTVEMTIGKELPSDTQVTAMDTGGWSQMLGELAADRTHQGVAEDVYLFGAFNPTDDWGSFCGGGCVAGLSSQALTAGDAFSRSSIGLGFAGSTSALTMAHEVGHAAGRNHSPGCGAAGEDPAYPNDEGLLDYRGYDPVDGWLQETDTTYDIMSYCSPYGVSAFTTNALATRIAEVNHLYSGKDRVQRTTYLSLWAHSDGQLRWGMDRSIFGPLVGEPRKVELLDAGGKSLGVVDATFAGFADLPGGTYVFADPGFAVARVRADGVLSDERKLRDAHP